MNKLLFGLIGYPLGHSFSKTYFSQKFEKEEIQNCSYELFPISNLNLLPELLAQNPDLKGLNVTIPYKESVLQYLDFIDTGAKRIGAVNVIRINSDGKLYGYNSDYAGFATTLLGLKSAKDWKGIHALVFGSGGSSKSVAACLEDFGIDFRIVSRKASGDHLTYEELNTETMKEFNLLVQCTPVGMFPKTEDCIPVPYHSLSEKHIAIDLVYNPEETMFMRKVKEQGGVAINGLTMLHAQAEKAWEIWNS